MTFPEFLTTLRQADEQATKGPWRLDYNRPAPWMMSFVMDEPHCYNHAFLSFDCRGEQQRANAHAIALLRNTLAQTIAIMEVARKAIEDAPHERKCQHFANQMPGNAVYQPCNCWKSRALAEMDALAAKTP